MGAFADRGKLSCFCLIGTDHEETFTEIGINWNLLKALFAGLELPTYQIYSSRSSLLASMACASTSSVSRKGKLICGTLHHPIVRIIRVSFEGGTWMLIHRHLIYLAILVIERGRVNDKLGKNFAFPRGGVGDAILHNFKRIPTGYLHLHAKQI